MHIEQDVVDFEMGDTDAKSGPDSIVGIGDKRDLFTVFCFSLSGEKLLEMLAKMFLSPGSWIIT